MANPCNLPVLNGACRALGGATKAVAGSAFQAVVDAFTTGLGNVVKALMTFWVHAPDPDVGAGSSVVLALDQLTRPLVGFAAVLGLVVGGARLAWTARHEQSAQSILRGLLLMTAVTATGAAVVELMVTGFDALARYVLDHGFNGRAVTDQLYTLIQMPSPAQPLGGGLVFILAFFGMIASIVQAALMVVRGPILAVLVGILPIAAAASITEVGYAWFKRLCGWILSFSVYKLCAGIIYAAAFTLIGSSKDLLGIISGFALLVVAILALPALLRLLPPSAEAFGAGAGGALAGAAAAAATGAVLLASRGGGGGSSPAATHSPGLTGDSAPTGASPTGGGPRGSAPALPAATGAAGTAGVVVAAASAAHGAAKSAASNAAGSGGESS